jgi:methyl-accepting chemotaxis protein
VVAEEVRKLAEQSSQASGEIRGTIGDIIGVIGYTDERMTASEKLAYNARETLVGTKDAFERIGAMIEKVASEVDTSSGLLSSVEKASCEVSEFADQTVNALDNTSAHLQEISASSDIQGSMIDGLRGCAQNLDSVVHSLNDNVGKFRTR